MQQEATYVGIDVAKEMLDVALRPTGERWRVAHDAAGLEHGAGRGAGPGRAGGDRRSGAGAGRRAGRGGAAGRGGQSAPDARLRPRDRDAGQDRCARRGGAARPCGRRCGRSATPRPRPCASCSRGVASWSGCGSPKASGGASRPTSPGWSSMSALEDELRQALQQSPVWRERDGCCPCPSSHAAGRAAGAGPAGPPPGRRAGRRGALQPRQRPTARQTHDLGRARPGARRALHGRAQRQPPQSAGDACWWPARSPPHAQAARDPQRDAQTPHALARLEPPQRPLS